MISIDEAILQSQNKANMSDGGSACFDFGNVVLVKYNCAIKYLKNGERARNQSEAVMAAVNQKAAQGVNTPRHLAIKRVVEGENDVCYVLQEKCPGVNCAKLYKSAVSFDEQYENLKFMSKIPFEHYQKLVRDGLMLREMGHEAKNKNLFYDKASGFWYIDFQPRDMAKEVFNPNDLVNLCYTLRYCVYNPKFIAFIDRAKLTNEQIQMVEEVENTIDAKLYLAKKTMFPQIEKYEKFLLFRERDDYKQYLMQAKIVNHDLTKIEDNDYVLYQKLQGALVDKLLDKVVNQGTEFWQIETNEIRWVSGIFNLQAFFEKSKYNPIQREQFINNLSSEEYEDDYERESAYKHAVGDAYNTSVIREMVKRLQQMEPNENINRFLSAANEEYQSNPAVAQLVTDEKRM